MFKRKFYFLRLKIKTLFYQINEQGFLNTDTLILCVYIFLINNIQKEILLLGFGTEEHSLSSQLAMLCSDT